MYRLINVGYGNMINAAKVVAIIHADSSPARHMIQKAREDGCIINATQGRKTQGILVMENGWLVLSALLPDTLTGRFRGLEEDRNLSAGKDNPEEDKSLCADSENAEEE